MSWLFFLLLIHVFGVVVGFGAALTSDFIAMVAYKDGRLNRSETKILQASSQLVWFGLFLIVVTGVLIFLTDPIVYMASSKFLAKMTIVLILIFNGLALHRFFIGPIVKRLQAVAFTSLTGGQRQILPIMIAVSFCSWFFALALGSLRGVTWSVGQILGVYFLTVLGFVCLTKLAISLGLLGRHLQK